MRQLCRRCQGTGRDLGYPMDGYACMRCKGKKVEPQQETTVKHDDGGPAYPASVPTDWYEKHGGMSLLDAFAMHAMVGILRNLEGLRPDDIPLMASDAYGIAAAMVAEKRRREGGGA